MTVRLKLFGAVVLVAMGLTTGVAIGRQIAPGPIPRVQSTFEVESVPVPLSIVQAVLDFPIGTSVPAHVHGGAAYVTILDGELTVDGPDGAHVYRRGDMLVEQPGAVYVAWNSGDVPASLVVSYLIPRGAPVTTVVD